MPRQPRLASFVVAWACLTVCPGGLPAVAAKGPSQEKPSITHIQQINTAVSAKILRYSQRLLEQYDSDGNGRLEEGEWRRMGGDPRAADFDADGVITVGELVRRVTDYGRRRKIRLMPDLPGRLAEIEPLLHPTTASGSVRGGARGSMLPGKSPASAKGDSAANGRPKRVARHRKFFVPAGRLPPALPKWFASRDVDGDGQLTLSEYAPGKAGAQVQEFTKYDANGDGVITVKECLRGVKPKTEADAEEEAKEPPVSSDG